MQTKKIKNYIVLALIILVGLFTLWEDFTEEDKPADDGLVLVEESSNSALLEEDSSDEEDTPAIETDKTQVEDQTESIQETETTADANDLIYEQALEEISGYNDITQVLWLSEVPEEVQASYKRYADDGWQGLVDGQTDGTKAGGTWRNYDDQLPKQTLSGYEVTYKEFDVNNKISGRSRDAERFVTGSDGSVYYTYDHYDSFVRLIE